MKKSTTIIIKDTLKIEKYLENFHKEEIRHNKYEKLNTSFNKELVNFITNPPQKLPNKEHIDVYLEFEKNFKPVSEADFSYILRKKSYAPYYVYYSNILPITFAVEIAVETIRQKTKFKDSAKKKYTLTTNSVNYIKLLTNCVIYDHIEMDNCGHNRFYRKRTANELLEMLKTELGINIVFSDDLLHSEYYTDNEMNSQLKLFSYKIIWYIEDILVKLGVALPFISYSHSYIREGNKSTQTSDESGGEIAEQIELDTELMEDLKMLPKGKKTLKTITTSTEKKNITYKHTGTRYLVFSKQIQLIKNLVGCIFRTPPILMENNLIFSDTYKHKIFVYNAANNEKTSKFDFNLDLISKIITTPISFKKELYEEISTLFTTRFLDDDKIHKNISNNTKFYSIKELLDNLFLEVNILPLYFPYIVDFRGRIYVNSPLSITDIKLLRFIITPHIVSTKVKTTSYFYKKLKKYTILIDLLDIKSQDYTDEKKVIILMGLLNLGKIKKSHLIKDCGVHIEEFIKMGINLYNSETVESIMETYDITDIEDIGEIITLKKKIKDYIQHNTVYSILLDSTASGIFHLNSWLHVRSEYHKYLNITDTDTWYDTYSFLLMKTKEVMGDSIPDEVLKMFTRKRIKRIFMTLPYNATKYTLRAYFQQGLSSEEKQTIIESKEERMMPPEIKKVHIETIREENAQAKKEGKKIKREPKPDSYLNIFLNAVSVVYENIFLVKPDMLLQLPYFNSSYIFTLDNNVYDFSYYETEKIVKEMKVDGNRWTFTEVCIMTLDQVIKRYEDKEKKRIEGLKDKHKDDPNYKLRIPKHSTPTTNLDKKKSNTAFPANVMHCSDATLLKKVFIKCRTQNIHIHTVHDEFIVPVNHVFEFLEILNEAYSEMNYEINKKDVKFQSFFMVL